jgi:hypothetical protein
MKKTGFGFCTSVFFCEIVGPIAQKRRAGQVPKDDFSIRQVFFRHTLVKNHYYLACRMPHLSATSGKQFVFLNQARFRLLSNFSSTAIIRVKPIKEEPP